MTRRPGHTKWKAAVCAVGTFLSGGQSFGQELADVTRLLSMRDDSSFSSLIASTSTKGYQLSDGSPIRFEDWYSGNWRDLSVTWMTQVDDNASLIWGLGTGEKGLKYQIDPSLQLGMVYQFRPRENEAFSFTLSTVFGGALSEDTCSADFGAIGGVQEVNCRLAASPLPPAETLNYVYDAQPRSSSRVELRYEFRF